MKIGLGFCCLLISTWAIAQTNYSALFLGNSYTGVNDLPGIVQSLTSAGGDTLTKDVNAPGGYTLQGHSTNPTSLAMIHARPWDFVILQEQSQLPSFPQRQVQTDVYPYAAQLNDTIKANDSCSVTVFYMTWGRKYGDASNCGNWPPVCTYAGMQAQLRMSYLNMANQNSALVAPCGAAWWESILRDSTLELYNPDQSHPSYAGSYLNGCVFYATMYRRSPVGLNFFGGLDTTVARYLQQVAHDVVFDSLAQWRVGLDDAQAAFTFALDPNGTTHFINASLNSTTYQWNFGDGGQDSSSNPVHLYLADGTYPATLIVSNGCTADTMVDSVHVVLTGLQAHKTVTLDLFPNPSHGTFHLVAQGLADGFTAVSVKDIRGHQVHYTLIATLDGSLDNVFDLKSMPSGTYLVELLDTDGVRVVRRLIVD